jgi:branched-chain amino acid transport system substrate-binding protein
MSLLPKVDGMNRSLSMRLRSVGCLHCLLAVCLLMTCLVASAQNALAANEIRNARRALGRGKFDQALSIVAPLLQQSETNQYRESRLIAADAWIGKRDFSRAISMLAPLIGDAPPMADDAPWVSLLARALQGQGLLMEAADWWLTYAAFGDNEAQTAADNLAQLNRAGLTAADIAYLTWKYPDHPQLCPSLDQYFQSELRRGHNLEALRIWRVREGLCEHNPDGTISGLPAALARAQTAAQISLVADDFFTIGVLAPLNGPYARFGITLANGVDVARRIYNSDARRPLKLAIADTGGSPAGCLDAMTRLYHQGVRVFIGEIFSLHTLMGSAYLRERNAILLSPTATDSLVAHQGAGTYICSVGASEQLEIMADYMADSLTVKRLALFWPNTADGRHLAGQFADLANQRGVAIAKDEFYRPGTTDFDRLLGQRDGGIMGEMDAVFCPGDMRELVAMISLLAHQGFLGPFFGMQSLGDPVVSSVVEEFGLQVIYPGNAYVAPADTTVTHDFAATYLQLFGETPDDFAHRGWIAFGVLSRAMEEGGYNPEALLQVLEESAATALESGEGRRLAVPPSVGRPAVYLQQGNRTMLIGNR